MKSKKKQMKGGKKRKMVWGKRKEEPKELPRVYQKEEPEPQTQPQPEKKPQGERFEVVKELPTFPIREYQDKDTGETVHLVTIEEALSRMMDVLESA